MTNWSDVFVRQLIASVIAGHVLVGWLVQQRTKSLAYTDSSQIIQSSSSFSFLLISSFSHKSIYIEYLFTWQVAFITTRRKKETKTMTHRALWECENLLKILYTCFCIMWFLSQTFVGRNSNRRQLKTISKLSLNPFVGKIYISV